MLRIVVILIGAALIAGGFFVLAQGPDSLGSACGLFIVGALFIAGTIFERRYRPKPAPSASWEKTGERFVDPTTGKMTEVRYNPQTGEREYLQEP